MPVTAVAMHMKCFRGIQTFVVVKSRSRRRIFRFFIDSRNCPSGNKCQTDFIQIDPSDGVWAEADSGKQPIGIRRNRKFKQIGFPLRPSGQIPADGRAPETYPSFFERGCDVESARSFARSAAPDFFIACRYLKNPGAEFPCGNLDFLIDLRRSSLWTNVLNPYSATP